MPSKLKKAFRAAKDQTSIGLAHICPRSSPALEVAVLKATSHDDHPADDRRLTEVVLLAASSPAAAAAVASALRRRISRTRNWVVALKCLSVAAAAISDSGPDFRPELAARRVLDLSLFSDASSRSSPWDFTAFVRTYALYLDARLQSSLSGHAPPNHRRRDTVSADAKPSLLLDRVARLQRTLDRAIGTRPTGRARSDRLVRATLHQVVREAHDLYRNVSKGLSLLLAGFFHLPRPLRAAALAVCSKAATQFVELEDFYVLCRNLGVGRPDEYPDVQRITKLLLHTLEQFVNDHNDDEAAVADSSSSTPPLPRREPEPAEGPWEAVLKNGGTSACTALEQQQHNRYSKIVSGSGSARNPFLDRDGSDKGSSVASTPSPSSSKSTPTPLALASSYVYRTRKEAAEEEEAERARKKMERDPFAKSLAWARRMDGPAREKLIEEQQMWLQHQNKMKRSLGW